MHGSGQYQHDGNVGQQKEKNAFHGSVRPLDVGGSCLKSE
jgi:hypothetical protein